MVILVLYVALQSQYYPTSLPVKIHVFNGENAIASCATVAESIVAINPDIVIRATCQDENGEVKYDSSLK